MVSLESCQDLPATTPPISAARHVTRPVTGRRSCGRTNEPLPIVSASGCNSHFCMTRSRLDAVLLAGGMQLEGGWDPLGPPSNPLQAVHHPRLVILGYDVMAAAGEKMCPGWPAERQDHYKCVLVLLFADPFRLPSRLGVEEGWSKTQSRRRITLAPTHRRMAWDCVACSLSARGRSATLQPITFGGRDQNHELRKHRMPRPACREGYGTGPYWWGRSAVFSLSLLESA